MDNFRFDEQKSTSLRHKITDDIRKAIFKGHLKPGSRLREVEISKQMGVSRGPIREAMRMLEQEGLINSHPYKETMVAEMTAEEVTEVLIPIRVIIEQYTIRKALPIMDETHYGNLRRIVDKMKESAVNKDIDQMADCDLAFHEYLVKISDMSNMIMIWRSVYNRIRLHLITQIRAYVELNVLCEEHEKLLAAIMEGDPDKVSEALTAHIHSFNLGILK